MTINMVKLCVGAEDIDDLRNWQKRLMRSYSKPFHQTRMVPKRAEELANGGSIYWVIKGAIQVRQTILEVKEIVDRSERKACELIFDPKIVLVEPMPKRPFQGWRYLKPDDSPRDLTGSAAAQEIPAGLRAGLRDAMVW